jgi:hypothetical protein
MIAVVKLHPRPAPKPASIEPRLQFAVGKSDHGCWVAREHLDRCGGIFTTRAEAIRFALKEARDTAVAVVIVPEAVELFSASRRIPIGEKALQLTQVTP